jgi:hypothetical protein
MSEKKDEKKKDESGTKPSQDNYTVSPGNQASTVKVPDIQKQPEKKNEQKKEASKPLDIITRPLTPNTGRYAQLGTDIPIVGEQEKGKKEEKKSEQK